MKRLSRKQIAREALVRGDWQTVLDVTEQMIARYPGDPDGNDLRGEAYLAMDKPAMAAVHFAARVDPQGASDGIGRSLVRLEASDRRMRRSAAAEVVAWFRKHPPGQSHIDTTARILGIVLPDLQPLLLREATYSFSRMALESTRDHPTSAASWAAWGRYLDAEPSNQVKAYERALAITERCVEQTAEARALDAGAPTALEIRQRLVRAFALAKRWTDAASLGDRVVAEDPRDVDAQMCRAHGHLFAGNYGVAEQAYLQAIAAYTALDHDERDTVPRRRWPASTARALSRDCVVTTKPWTSWYRPSGSDPKSRDEWVRDEWLEPLRGREDFRALTDVGVARPANRDGQRAVAQARRDRRVLTDPVERAALANAVLDERRFWRASLQAVERTLGNDDVAREFVAVVDLALGGPIDADVLDDDDLDDDAAYIDAAEDFVAAVLARRPRFSWIVRAVDKEIPNVAGVVPVLEALRVLERCCVKAIREGNEALSHYEAEPP